MTIDIWMFSGPTGLIFTIACQVMIAIFLIDWGIRIIGLILDAIPG